ncbi:MAG: M20/M25/M40 family metallo-hydrolase [Methanobacteriota archaeon]|nr:MAG: M20/M25/M40 family metallo-hydrolase [Euryarchaeota archaeon]
MPLTDVNADVNEVIELARELVKIPSVYMQEAEISNFIYARLDEWGLSPRRVPVENHGPCIVAESGAEGAPSVVLNGHMDTVEVMAGWEHDPFGAEIEDGRLFGLGSLDMKSGLAAMMIAFRNLFDSECTKRRRLVFQAVPGEELDGSGTRTLIKEGSFEGAEAVIVGEGFGGLGAVTNGRRGGAYYDFEVMGQSAHGAMPHLGKNAVVDASKIICALEESELAVSETLKSDAYELLRETQTILQISGGGDSLSVPERCRVRFVRCTIPGGRTDLQTELESMVADLSLVCVVKIEFKGEPGNLYLPYLTNPSEPLVKAAVASLDEHVGSEPVLVCGVSEADDNLIAQELGLPVICVGPGESGETARYHQPEESIETSQLATAVEVYTSIVRRLCGI